LIGSDSLTIGIQLWVSDDHKSYCQAIRPSDHLLCAAHFKKNKFRRVRELKQQARSEGMKRDLEELEVLLREAPADGKQSAREIYRRQKRVSRPAKGKKASPQIEFGLLTERRYDFAYP
jgi:hypothetical protein